jgi:hypothetical protein
MLKILFCLKIILIAPKEPVLPEAHQINTREYAGIDYVCIFKRYSTP